MEDPWIIARRPMDGYIEGIIVQLK